jgi:hypothetical protein
MNVRPAKLAQPVVEIGLNPQDAVPNMEAAAAIEAAGPFGTLPLLALVTAVAATVVWNGFLLWEAATLVFSWMGF